MLSAGTNISSSSDSLKKVPVDYLYHSLRNPKSDVESRIRQLRIVRDLDSKQYSLLKRQLPYIVCGMFNPPYRRTDNFAYTEYFILDIDHLSEKELIVSEVRKNIESDNRVLLCFSSPGEDGLKVLFQLKDRCYDAGYYSLFYKAFAQSFSKQHKLEQVIDARTSDVCRACFVSIDHGAYYNTEAVKVDINDYLSQADTTQLFDLKKELTSNESPSGKEKSVDPDQVVLDQIKSLLNPKADKKNKAKTAPYVPEQLEEIMEDLKKFIEQTGVIVYEVINIQYAKKIRFKTGMRQAEINLFYGKHGYSVVQSPRCGTSSDLNQMMADLIETFLNEYS